MVIRTLEQWPLHLVKPLRNCSDKAVKSRALVVVVPKTIVKAWGTARSTMLHYDRATFNLLFEWRYSPSMLSQNFSTIGTALTVDVVRHRLSEDE